MEKESILAEIKRIAHQLHADGKTWTRADLAYQLREQGVAGDSLEVSRMVWETFLRYGNDKTVATAFVDNVTGHSLVEEYRLHSQLATGQADEAVNSVEESLRRTNDVLGVLKEMLAGNLEGGGALSPSAMECVIGTGGISTVKHQAGALIEHYSRLVDDYGQARDSVRDTLRDFVALRDDILRVYKKYAYSLIDIFGDGIKAVAPELFDFEQIQFLNTEEMLGKVKLSYNQLTEHCDALLAEVGQSFNTSVSTAVQAYQNNRNRMGLLIAVAGMVSHYVDVTKNTAQVKRQFDTLKGCFKHDSTLIRGDEARLTAVYKRLNDVAVPQAALFYKNASRLLSHELDELLQEIYSEPQVKALATQRDDLLADMQHLETLINDCQANIDTYTEHIANTREFLRTAAGDYNHALSTKPTKPLAVSNVLTLGSKNKDYEHSLYEWNEVCAPLVEQYDRCKADLQVDQEEITSLQRSKQDYHLRYQAQLKKLRDVNRQILEQLTVSPRHRLAMAEHLKDIIGLLHVGKQIAETRLDSSLMNTVRILDLRDMQLPSEVDDAMQRFTDNLRNSAHGIVRQAMGESETAAASIDEAATALQQWSRLKAEQACGMVTEQAYDMQLRLLREKFIRDMEWTDNRAAALRKVLQKANLTTDDETMKQALLDLATDQLLSEQDMELLLQGKKSLEI